jgi:hypothetical protein
MQRFLPFVIAVALAATLLADSAPAQCRRMARAPQYAASSSWHGGYYHSAWGMPMALVVSPKAEFQTHWGWGVGNTRSTVIWHQFRRDYPGPGAYDPRLVRPTPYWPSDTDQFGVYYIRGPW